MNSETKCYCCTCGETEYGRLIWNPSCRNHGAHGLSACNRHGLPIVQCDCGCGHVTKGPDLCRHCGGSLEHWSHNPAEAECHVFEARVTDGRES